MGCSSRRPCGVPFPHGQYQTCADFIPAARLRLADSPGGAQGSATVRARRNQDSAPGARDLYVAADAGLRATAVYVGRVAGPVSVTPGAHWPSGVTPGGIRSISRKNLANCSRDRSVSGMLACELYLSVASSLPGQLDVAGRVRGDQVATGADRVQVRADHRVRVVVVRDVVQDPQHDDGHRLAEVQRLRGLGQHRAGIRASASTYAHLPCGPLRSSASACERTIGSLST